MANDHQPPASGERLLEAETGASAGADNSPRAGTRAVAGRPVMAGSPLRTSTASRQRLLLTGLGGAAIFWMSWRWGQPQMLRWSLLPGAAIAAAGLLLRMWATGWLCKNEVLVTGGPYAFTRNPLYLGTCLIALGQSLMSGLPPAPLLFPALCLVLYWPTVREEENYLAARYDAQYEAYRTHVPWLLPRLSPWSGASDSALRGGHSFSWARVRRCYKGFLANALVIAVYVLMQARR